MNYIEAQNEMVQAYADEIKATDRLTALAKDAFPVGMEFLCTNWRYAVYVTVREVYSHDRIRVVSQTGREYCTRADCLGVDYGEALRVARGRRP